MALRLVSADEMRSLDRLTIEEFGVPSFALMRRAATGAVKALRECFSAPQRRRVLVVAGRGNNGGDAMVCARLLAQSRSHKVRVALAARREELRGDAARAYTEAARARVPVEEAVEAEQLRSLLREASVVVDGLLGTGLNAPVAGYMAELIDAINASGKPVLSLDIPSGLDANHGVPLGSAVIAAVTVTFGFAKIGQVVYPGRQFVGRLHVVDIGIPPEAEERIPARAWQLEAVDVARRLPVRPPTAHKGHYGHVLVIGGSLGRTGAALMATEAAARVGAGLATLGGPASLNTILASRMPEIMTFALPDDGGLLRFEEQSLRAALEQKSAVVLGPGMGVSEDSARIVEFLLTRTQVPVVVDADALTCMSTKLRILEAARGRCVLTPHPGEMARLCNRTTAEIQSSRTRVAREFAAEHGCVLVLKGATTLIADADGTLWVNPTGNPGMASGGMGDVLAGLVGGLLAQGLTPRDAALVAVFVHGAAADALAQTYAPVGYLASEVAREVPRQISALRAWP